MKHSTYMAIAELCAKEAKCLGQKVGAVLVRENRIIATGYNGTPMGFRNCPEGGCVRCSELRVPGKDYDLCCCVHAEQNTILTAGRFGVSAEKAVLYTTRQPCFSCLVTCLQAGVAEIIYRDKWDVGRKSERLEEQYEALTRAFRFFTWRPADFPISA